MAKSVVEAPYHAQDAPHVDDTRFYAVALAANPGRAIVRDWIDTTLAEVDSNVRRWFNFHRIIDPATKQVQEFDIKRLAASTVRSKAKGEARKPIITTTYALLRSAILGQRLPSGLLHQVVRRCQTERTVSTERAALIKVALLSQPNEFLKPFIKEKFMEQVEPDFQVLQDPRTTAAYHCGRVLAILERIQQAAVGRGTVIGGFFGAVLTTPGLTLPTLLRAAHQAHLPKIRGQNEGAFVNMRRQLDEALGKVPSKAGIPPVLKLQEQGWLILGYHHQRAADESNRREKAAQKRREVEAEQADLFEDTTDEASI
jgi:CRISPR-associated protein Csd1